VRIKWLGRGDHHAGCSCLPAALRRLQEQHAPPPGAVGTAGNSARLRLCCLI